MATPERRLWLAIIAQTLTDVESLKDRLDWQFKKDGWTQIQTIRALKEIESHVKDPWFRHICAMAEVNYSRVRNHLCKDNKRYYEMPSMVVGFIP